MTLRDVLAGAAVFLTASFIAGFIGATMGQSEFYRGAVFGMWSMWLWLWLWERKP